MTTEAAIDTVTETGMDATITFKKDEVIVLLGAGASVDAGIPHSSDMVQQIERLIAKEWKEYCDLYNYVRSAIFYADGIRGTYASDVSYNIERLVVALDELSRREEHPIYPFVGAWNPRLIQVAGDDFRHVSKFKTNIVEKLRRDWIELPNYDSAAYFKGLISFQKELNYPLRVFSLNYDLCVERTYYAEYKDFPERGFDKDRHWSHELLEDSENTEKNLFLYKLHGSIDWQRDVKTGVLTYSDSTTKIKTDDAALIFGTTYKLQYVDPFLFLVYQLRRLSLDARLLIVIGYGFGDEHINGILAQALRTNTDKRIIAVNWIGDKEASQTADKVQRFKEFVAKQLELNASDDRLVLINEKAKPYLEDQLSIQSVGAHFPPEEKLF